MWKPRGRSRNRCGRCRGSVDDGLGARAGEGAVSVDDPLAIDLFCGLGGWTEGLLQEGYHVIGFDIERHCYGVARYPAQLVLQDVTTIHGAQFKDAALIVASPPCQAYSYRAMPWKRAKALPPPDNTLFEACFRIQREACEAANRYIPLVVENVCGAQKWVGRARWHYGSFYLWGDVPALMPIVVNRRMKFPADCGPRMWSEREYQRLNDGSASGLGHREGATRATKNDGGSWFNIAHNTTSGHGQNPDGRPVKGANGGWFNDNKRAGLDDAPGYLSRSGSKSNARKAASAHIAKIPLLLARHIARAWYPLTESYAMTAQGKGIR